MNFNEVLTQLREKKDDLVANKKALQDMRATVQAMVDEYNVKIDALVLSITEINLAIDKIKS